MRSVLIAAAVALATGSAASQAQTSVTGTYTATDTGTPGYIPTINDDGQPFLSSPFTESLTVGSTTTPTTFLQVAPTGSGNPGTVTGTIAVSFMLTAAGNSSVTGVTSTAGDHVATFSGGTVNISANYELFYTSPGNGTDCITWSSATCTVTGNETTIGDTIVVTFADNAVLDVNLYNWSDWNMAPNISFNLASAPHTTVPEPASLAVFASGIAGLAALRRRRMSRRPVADASN